MTPLVALAATLVLAPGDGTPPSIPTPAAFATIGDDGTQDLLILGESRPLLIRLRVLIGDRPFRSTWLDSCRSLHSQLDRDGNGKLTVAEAEAGGLALLIAPALVASVDSKPKDESISIDELTEALRASSGPFRLQAEGLEAGRTRALFDQFDRDKDGQLTRPELSTIVGSLRKLDRDDNELISTIEVEPAETIDPMEMTMPMGRGASRDLPMPPAIALAANESPLKAIRLMLKKYDKGSPGRPGKTDSRLSPEEFPIPPRSFEAVDANHDGRLNSEELRGYLSNAPRDANLDVFLTPEATGRGSVRVRGVDGDKPEGLEVRTLSEAVVEVEVGLLRLDFHLDDGLAAIDSARRILMARFSAADANQDGYLEESEVGPDDNGLASPLAGLFATLDRNGDNKVYAAEVDEFVTRSAASARGRLSLDASDQGHALFGLLDLDRDGQLGAREVLDTFARVSACDRDRDGKITPEEIPHHIRVTLTRGDLSSLLAVPANPNQVVVANQAVVVAPRTRVATGPAWFRKMDRNHDGDVSRREFLGTHEQFDQLDRDHDGLVGPDEAEFARRPKN